MVRMKDCNGVTTVFVTEEDLQDFTKFIRWIRENDVGKSVGGFLIQFEDTVKRKTKLEDLFQFLKRDFQCKKKSKKWVLDRQTFFKGCKSEHVYGFRRDDCSAKDFANFVATALDPASYSNETCCTKKLRVSEEDLIYHYWKTIEKSSILSTELQKKTALCSDDNINNNKKVTDCETEDLSVLYGCSIALNCKQFEICEGFSLSRLGTVIDVSKRKYPGLACPYMYVGKEHSTFVWHIEDCALWSINIVHFGAAKIWFLACAKDYYKLTRYLSNFYLDLGHLCCSNLLGHKYVAASTDVLNKLGLKIVQKEGQMVVTLPYAAHSGFDTGPNISEAVNFRDDVWVDQGLFAPKCTCLKDQVHFDMEDIVRLFRPHLLRPYLEGTLLLHVKAFPDEDYVGSTSSDVPSLKRKDSFHTTSPTYDLSTSASCSGESQDTNIEEYHFGGARQLLICPERTCQKTYKDGRSKLHRLINHVSREHPLQSSELHTIIERMYPVKKNCSIGNTCQICGEVKAGNVAHLRMHHQRKHKGIPFSRPAKPVPKYDVQSRC